MDKIELNNIEWYVRPETNDLGILQQVFVDNACMLPDDMENMIFVDIGAHIGAASLLAAQRRATYVVAVEAGSENYQMLLKNAHANFPQQIRPLHIGAGFPGIRPLYLHSYNTGMNSAFLWHEELKPDQYEFSYFETLDYLIRDYPYVDFMKIDCEGCESEIIDEIAMGLHEKIRTISIEFHQNQEGDLVRLCEFYNSTKLHGSGYLLHHKEDI